MPLFKSPSPAQADATTTTAPNTTTREPPYSIFDKRQKWLIIAIVSTTTTFSGFALNIYFPALPIIANDLHVSIELVNLSVTCYLIFQGLAPSLWGTFIVFLGACIGQVKTKSYAQLVILRCIQSTGSARTIAIGSGVIGDITARDERGGLGPAIGGAIARSLGWKAIFWFLTIYSGVFLCLLMLLLPETLRSIVANGSRTPSNPLICYPLDVYPRTTKMPWQDMQNEPPQPSFRKKFDLHSSFRMRVSHHAASIIIFLAIYYAVWQMSITAMSSLFEKHYNLSQIQTGLTFIANGVGSMIGTLVTGKILDADYHRLKTKHEALHNIEQYPNNSNPGAANNTERNEDFPLEKVRLRLVPVFSVLHCCSIFLFGWTIQYPQKVYISVPIISTFITGLTDTSSGTGGTTYSVEVCCWVEEEG
ncbi:major facilitator superfamily domain-containing protein [Aspergillus granulosus]|uniref:Major facilitator superfamily domain-containing protein n=1 Tax=Aspergillus granulosus TaxID=176169 RepID=A0ABR4HCZ8_9EURO